MALQREISIAFALIEEQAAEAGDDEVFLALVGLRAAIMRMISSRAVHLNPLVTYRVVSETPANALTLAWRLYQDSGGRDLEIVARVAARNPAFLPMTGRVLAA
jgi:prophage DNA circulation protein